MPRTIRPDLAALLLIVFVSATAPAFLEDDAAFFNYFANVDGATPLFFYKGYVSFIAMPIAYALSGLPFALQAVLYRAVALVAVWLWYRELVRLFAMGGRVAEARWLAVATLLLARGVDIHLWANLTYAIWPAFFAATLFVIRANIEQRRYPTVAVAGVLLAGLSNPLGLLLAPLLTAFARVNRQATLQNLGLAATLAAGHTWIYSQSPDALIGGAGPIELARLLLHGYRTEFKLNTLVVSVSMASIAVATWRIWRRPPASADRAITWSLAFLGSASVVVYMLSDRFTLLDGGFRSQHGLTPMVGALVIIGRAILSVPDAARRGLLLGLFLGMSAATFAREMYFHLRGPLELSLMKYRFLTLAGSFRETCHEPDAMVFEDHSESPIVLCRPRALPIGRHPMLDVPPSVGTGGDDDEDPLERPGLVVGTPLFGRRLTGR